MITEDQLKELLADLEADHIERTVSVDNTDKFCQAICAFANDLPNHRRPGYLLVGVRDNGALSGLTVTDELLKNLGGIRSDGAIGAHIEAVSSCYKDFQKLAGKIALPAGISFN